MEVGDLVLDLETNEMTIVIAILDDIPCEEGYGIMLKSLVCGEEFEVWDNELIEVINETR